MASGSPSSRAQIEATGPDVLLVEREARGGPSGALDEQPRAVEALEAPGRRVGRRDGERGELDDRLAGASSRWRLVASTRSAGAAASRRSTTWPAAPRGARVVEDEQRAAVAQVVRRTSSALPAVPGSEPLPATPTAAAIAPGISAGSRSGASSDRPDAVGEVVEQRPPGLGREARLAHAAGPGHGDEAVLASRARSAARSASRPTKLVSRTRGSSRPACGRRPGVLQQDAPLEPRALLGGLEPSSSRRCAVRAVGLQRLHLAAGAVEREHLQCRPAPRDAAPRPRALELGQRLGVAAEGEQRAQPRPRWRAGAARPGAAPRRGQPSSSSTSAYGRPRTSRRLVEAASASSGGSAGRGVTRWAKRWASTSAGSAASR